MRATRAMRTTNMKTISKTRLFLAPWWQWRHRDGLCRGSWHYRARPST